jgi:hypothetical protein
MRLRETELFKRFATIQTNEPFKLVVYVHGTEEELNKLLKMIELECSK